MTWASARLRSVSAFTLLLLAPTVGAQIVERWSLGETTPLAGADDEVTALAATAEGRMVFAVHALSGASQSTRVRCRDAAGALAWDIDPEPAGVHLAQAHTRRGGGAYFTGTWSSPAGSAPPRVVATRIDESGTQLWTDQWAPPGFDVTTDSVRSTVDDMGYLWVTGTFAAGHVAFARHLSPLGVVRTHTEIPLPARTSIRSACTWPYGGVATVGEQDQHPLVRVFDPLGGVQFSHVFANVAPGTLSSYVDVACNAQTGHVFACGTIDEGLNSQSGLISEFRVDGSMVQGLLVRVFYGADNPSSFEAITLRSDGRPHVIGRIRWYPPQWSVLWLELMPGGGAVYGVTPWGAPPASAYPGARVLAGSTNEIWSLTPWGPPALGQPTEWILEEFNHYHYTAASFSAFPRSAADTPARWLGLERVDEGLAVFGSLGPQPDGSTDGELVTLDTHRMPTGYCSTEGDPLGCQPWLAWSGQLWSSSQPMYLFAGQLSNQSSALALYSTTGPTAVPFLAGTLCVAPPLRRSAVKFTGGTPSVALDCSGTFQVQLSNLLAPDPFAHVPGNEIFLQVWSRYRGDGNGHGTAAIRITVP